MPTIIVTAVALILTLPFVARIKISYDGTRRYFFLKIYFVSIRIASVKVLITDEVYFFFGKKVKPLKLLRLKEHHANKIGRLVGLPVFAAGSITIVYGKAEAAEKTARVCALLNATLRVLEPHLTDIGVNLRAVSIVPIFNGDIFNVRANLIIIGNPLKIFSWIL